jgi:Protein phosphatase 2C
MWHDMQITFATAGAPGRANEDYACAGGDWALVLDGATAIPGVDSGCAHDVRWLVRRLAAAISSRLIAPDASTLPDVLAAAIKDVRDAHASPCDLVNPDSPSATVAVVRCHGDALEYLVLGDSPIVLRRCDGSFTQIADDRASGLPGGRPYTAELVREHRNKPGGFWVASTDAGAAYQALTGTAPLVQITEVALFTDGVARLADWYGHTWPGIFSCLRTQGPASLIELVRAAEKQQPPPYGKQHDDATAVYLRNL